MLQGCVCHRVADKTNWAALVLSGEERSLMQSFWAPPGRNSHACGVKELWGCRVYGVRSPCAGSEGGLCWWVS